ncbi:dynein assembly factor 4, axonemal-like [Agrilus planipennis]|uniref:Dynein axonemal assembly factor 4 n=1 Tax=Agrilus planipennis TaxID=224129 RepID=A0A1W4WMZ4_AGRPL|nr:dynein assembly factor 4, axonemal-like [Agrilus planipennis]
MPLIIKNFTWKQSENLITLYVPMKGVIASKADIFTSPWYIKVSFAKHFFELFLLHEIDVKSSVCTITKDEVVFQLQKSTNGLWDTVERDLPKHEKNELKKNIITETHQQFQKQVEEKENKKHELKRIAVREQISLDTKQREFIEKIRNHEKNKELGDVEKWRSGVLITEISTSSEEEEEEEENEERKGTARDCSYQNKCFLKPSMIIRKKPAETNNTEISSVPLPRKQSTLSVTFTRREFPTPSRESKLEEENEWLRKQVEVRRTVGFFSDDLRPEERNPSYLKFKGDQFMKAKNYLAAISAYTFGIKLSENFVDLYIGRSEAHFLLEHYQKCVRDCSDALNLLKPPVASNFAQRITCIVRRGDSLCKIGMHREGIGELQAALDMQSDNEEIRMKIEKAMLQFKDEMKKENNTDKKCTNNTECILKQNEDNSSVEQLEELFMAKSEIAD